MRLKQLEENVRYGQKEKDVVLKNLNDFKFGFEIEMNPGNEFIDEDTTFIEYLSERELDVTITTSESGDLAALMVNYIIDEDTYNSMYNNSKKFKIFNDDVISIFDFGDNITGDMFPFELHYTIIQTIIDMLKENGYDDVGDMQKTLSAWNGITTEQWKYIILALRNDADVDSHDVKEDDLKELSKLYGIYIDHLNTILSEMYMSKYVENGKLIPISDMNTEMRDDFNGFYDSELRNHVDRLIEISTEIKSNPVYSDELEFSNIHSDNLANEIGTDIDDLLGNHGLSLTEILKHFNLEDRYYEILDNLDGNVDLSNMDEYESYRNALEGSNHGIIFDDLSNTDNVYYKVEHDGQIEIVTTKPVSGKAILEHYKQMKQIISELSEYGYTADSNSGLHMSISYKNGSTGMNFNKFTVLSDMYKITEEDGNAVRPLVYDVFRYVHSADGHILNIILDNVRDDTNPISDIVNDVENGLTRVRTRGNGKVPPKYHGINFADYGSNGRVELRFFGGDNYDDRLDEYLDKLIKFMYILKISSDDTHDTNYYKALVKVTNKVFSKRFGMTIDEATRNAKVNMNLIKNRLGLEEYTSIDELHGEIEGITLKSKNSKVRAVLGDLLEYIEDRTYYQMMIDPDVTQALKILIQYQNSK